jgi:molybdopterin molybdotransferase
VEEAKARILAGVRALARERVPVGEALGRTLAADLKAKRDQPPCDVSAMDGYAVRASRRRPGSGTAGARRRIERRARLAAPGQARPGRPHLHRRALPEGADAIVIQENASRHDGHIEVAETARPAASSAAGGSISIAARRCSKPPAASGPASWRLPPPWATAA